MEIEIDAAVERLSTPSSVDAIDWSKVRDGDTLAPDFMDASAREWLVQQLVHWPRRVNPDFTTNDSFLRTSAARLIEWQAAEIARLSALPSDGVTIPADHIADAGKMVAARLRDEIGREAKDWRHNAYTRVMLAQWHDRLSAAPKAPPVAQAEGVVGDTWPDEWKRDGFNHAITQAQKALRYLASNDRPAGGEQFPNSASCYMIADELEVTRKRYAALSATTEQGEGEATGTFACPICGQDTPHHHGAEAVDALQNKGSRK